jgi:hypothetical protein
MTDSDIDIDENDEVKSDTEDVGESKKRKRLVTKAYKVSKLGVETMIKSYICLVCLLFALVFLLISVELYGRLMCYIQ